MKTVQIQLTAKRMQSLKSLGYKFKTVNFIFLNVEVPTGMTANDLIKQLKEN